MLHFVHLLQRRYPRGNHQIIAGVLLASGAALLVGLGLVLAR